MRRAQGRVASLLSGSKRIYAFGQFERVGEEYFREWFVPPAELNVRFSGFTYYRSAKQRRHPPVCKASRRWMHAY